MNVEALSNVIIPIGANSTGENSAQSSAGQLKEAFTATFQAQVQRLNPASSTATASISPVVAPVTNPTPAVDLEALIPELMATVGGSPNLVAHGLNQAVNSGALSNLDISQRAAAEGAAITGEMVPKIGQAINGGMDDAGVDSEISSVSSAEDTALPALSVKGATVAQPTIQAMPPTDRLATDNSSLSSQQKLALILKQNRTETADMPLDATNILTPVQKTEKSSTTEEASIGRVPTQFTEQDITQPDVNQINVQLSPPDTLMPISANLLEVTSNNLLQVGLLRPDFVNAPKIEKSDNLRLSMTNQAVTNLTSPQALVDNIAASISSVGSMPNEVVKNNLLVLSDPDLPHNAFTTLLDNLKSGDASISPGTDLPKSLANLGTELSTFDRSLTNPAKAEIAPMNSHIYSAHWNQELGSKITWMTSQQISSAELKLNPEHLGPISVQINMQQDQASITFTANSTAVRDMLEASIPKLREMLQTQQLNLADVNISQQSFSGQGQAQSSYFGQNSEGQKRSEPGLENRAEASATVNEVTMQDEQGHTLVTNGLVSVYA